MTFHSSWRGAVVFMLALCTAEAICAQQPEPEELPPAGAAPTLTVSAKMVALDAVVRNKQTGQLVLDAEKDVFTLRVDGHPAPIKYFSRDEDLPLTVGLLVDTSGSQREYFDDEALASDNFLKNTLVQKDDRAFIVRFDSQVLELQKMTSNLTELHHGLQLLDYKRDDQNMSGRGTLLYDAIARVCANLIGKEQGRRALVILTDGDDNGSRISMDGAIRLAQFEDVAVYTVLYTHEMIGGMRYPSSGRPSGIDVMTDISRQTGGRAFVVGQGMQVKQIFAEIAQDLRTQYRLGFTPAESKPGQLHKIELRATDKRLDVQARTGYVTPQ